MGIKIQYDTSVISVPGKITDLLDRASGNDLRVLLTLCESPDLCKSCGDSTSAEALAAMLDISPSDVDASIAFWRGAGVIVPDSKSKRAKRTATAQITEAPAEQAAPAPTPVKAEAPAVSDKTRKVARRDELPAYTTEQLTALLEERADTAEYINECQRLWGKMLNTHEINILLGLVDYLGLEWEYILLLLAHCMKTQERRGVRKSFHYVEKTAFAFYDEGVCDILALEERIRRAEMMAETEGKLRTLFGMGARALTPRETKYFATWLYEFKYDMDVIRLAYEVTVDTKGAFNISYMNSVLANWNRDGLRTPEDIQKAMDAFREEKESKKQPKVQKGSKQDGGSFDTDDFFAAAVRRSLGDDFADQIENS